MVDKVSSDTVVSAPVAAANAEKVQREQEEKRKALFQAALMALFNEWLKKVRDTFAPQQIIEAEVRAMASSVQDNQVVFAERVHQFGLELAQKLQEIERKLDNILKQLETLSRLTKDIAANQQAIINNTAVVNDGLTQIETSLSTLSTQTAPSVLADAEKKLEDFGVRLRNDLTQLRQVETVSRAIDTDIAQIKDLTPSSSTSAPAPEVVAVINIVEKALKQKNQYLDAVSKLGIKSMVDDLESTIAKTDVLKEKVAEKRAHYALITSQVPLLNSSSSAPRPSPSTGRRKDKKDEENGTRRLFQGYGR